MGRRQYGNTRVRVGRRIAHGLKAIARLEAIALGLEAIAIGLTSQLM